MNLGRTVKTNIILYTTDNMGRDGYITYNNGGFWKENIKQIKLSPNYPRYRYNTFHSLIHPAAPFNYHSDGSGRDSYVIHYNAGLVKEFNSLASRQILSKYLRSNEPFGESIKKKIYINEKEKKRLKKTRSIQKNVVNRLYTQCLNKFRNKMNVQFPSNKVTLIKRPFSSTFSPINKFNSYGVFNQYQPKSLQFSFYESNFNRPDKKDYKLYLENKVKYSNKTNPKNEINYNKNMNNNRKNYYNFLSSNNIRYENYPQMKLFNTSKKVVNETKKKNYASSDNLNQRSLGHTGRKGKILNKFKPILVEDFYNEF